MRAKLCAWIGVISLPTIFFTLLPAGAVLADPPSPRDEQAGASASSTKPADDADELPTIDVLEGLRSGQLAAEAEGIGDGRMTLSLTNRTPRKLRVVLPPGLIASGASGQFGGFGGGLGGGFGGMGGLGMGGTGMGGMGMGGMGLGGFGGMGMGGTGMGGMGMMGGGTLPASMGMVMLGQLIMSLIGDRDSWDQRSLMMGMMGGMGLGGMGMGGMGMGMGGMGGGFRSVPPTSLPETTLKPRQTRHLPTPLVSLGGPQDDNQLVMPEKGERLQLGAIAQVTDDARTQAALKRLAEDKAPQTVAQLVLWNVAAGLDWDAIARLSQGWANAHERALARQFVERLDGARRELPKADSGILYWDVTVRDAKDEPLAARLRTLLEKFTVLGLKAQAGVPDRPSGPALACRIAIDDTRAEVKLAATDANGTAWVALDPISLKLADDVADQTAAKAESKESIDPETRKATKVADGTAAGLLQRLVAAKLSKGHRVKGHETYQVRIANASPFILNGLALAGTDGASQASPTALAGLSLPPRKALTVPASAEMVDRLHLKDGVRVIAADLSGL